MTPTQNATDYCEAFLRRQIQSNVENNILPSESAVAERLLEHGVGLSAAYADLVQASCGHPHAVGSFLGMVLSVAAFWNPAHVARLRKDRDRLIEVNQQIAKQASALSMLLAERADLHNRSGFHTNTQYHVADVIEAASSNNHRHASFVASELRALATRFDLKYWPSLSEVVETLADDARNATVSATDPLTDAATASKRPSKSDVVMALLAILDEAHVSSPMLFPRDFHLTDGCLADFVNAMLPLEPEEMVSSEYIKGRRRTHRERTLAADREDGA